MKFFLAAASFFSVLRQNNNSGPLLRYTSFGELHFTQGILSTNIRQSLNQSLTLAVAGENNYGIIPFRARSGEHLHPQWEGKSILQWHFCPGCWDVGPQDGETNV